MILPTTTVRRQVFRAHNPRWSFSPLSGEGAARFGGRFNPVGTAALYTSLRMETAWIEAQHGFSFKPQPLTICAYDVHCRDILDLTDPAILDESEVRTAELACAWEDIADRGLVPDSWSLSERLIGQEVAGIVVPSFAPGADPARDLNLVLWDWGSNPPHQITLIDDQERLPKNDNSWL